MLFRILVILFALHLNAQVITIPKENYSEKEQFIISQERSFQKDTTSLIRFLKPLLQSNEKNYVVIYNTLLANGYAECNDSATNKTSNLHIEAVALARTLPNKSLEIWAKVNYVKYLYKYRRYKKMEPLLLELLTDTKDKKNSNLISARDIYQSLAWILQTLCDFEEAENYFNLALENSVPNSSERAAILDNLGYNYYKINNYDKALALFAQSSEMALINNDSLRYAKTLGNQGLVYESLKKYDQATGLLLEDIIISEKVGDFKNTMFAATALARIYLKNGDLENAENSIITAEKIATSKSHFKKAELEITKIKLEFLKSKPNSDEELAAHRRLIVLEDSLEQSDSEANINLLNWKLQKEKYENEIIKSQKLQFQQDKTNTILLSIAILLLIMGIGIFIYKKKKSP